ncbi:MAG: SufD family Fe-S cluster assembly protein [Clostridiales bacterium]|nr:SufD family Fe-S cluster assembly protein [Clostridiales bacterium]
MNAISEQLLRSVSDYDGEFKGAYNIRENGQCAARHSTENIRLEPKADAPGLDIHIKAGTKNEIVSIPAIVTHGNVDDLVYNDFYIGEDADVLIIAGCGVHTEDDQAARHNGIHRFFLEKGAKVKYVEKHIGTGEGEGIRSIDPVTEVELGENALLEMDTAQIGGVDSSIRVTKAKLEAGATLLIKESLLTEKNQYAKTEFDVEMNGEGAGTDLISRSVARDTSHQEYRSRMIGNAACTGHSECDAIIADHGTVDATPELSANHCDAALIHEAAIGKIAGEQILKLRTLGLTEAEAEAKIVEGFLSW